ncbi:MAG: penicillin-binding transpeptidase domain-containing protein, partial [Candidatus Brocadiia bacterium]
SKARILTAWLNRVSFGNQAHGIEAAAQLYFGTAARDLTPQQSTFLVGLPQSPSRLNPYRHPDRAIARQQQVLGALVASGALTPADSARWAALPLALRPPRQAFRAPHFTTALLQTEAPGQAREWRTTLDARLQAEIERRVTTRLQPLRTQRVTNAAVVVLENATGAIRAYVGSENFWNPARAGQNDGVRMLRQPGSALKPFVYGAALQSGRYTPASILPDVPLAVPSAGGAFTPTNYDRQFRGPVSVREALASSYNVPAVYLAREMGAAAMLRTLRDAGFASLDRAPSVYGVGLVLGNGEVTLLELAEAYAGLARGGARPTAHPWSWKRTARGDTVHLPPPAAQPMGLTPPTIAQLTDILSDEDARAPGFGGGAMLRAPFPLAVKTGTSQDYRDNWTVGYTPTHTVAVWVGNFDGQAMQEVSGVTGAGPIFHDVIRLVGAGGAFPDAGSLTTAEVCTESGLRPGAFCRASRAEVFQQGTAPTDTCTVHQQIAVDTRRGTRATPATPAAFVENRRYTVHPPEFHGWMRREGLLLPPPHAATAPAGRMVQANAPTEEGPLVITHPAPGAQYILDPTLRPAYQRLHFEGHAPEGWSARSWIVNGEPIAGPWPLEVGRHEITLSARDPDGHRHTSAPRVIRVLALEDRPSTR